MKIICEFSLLPSDAAVSARLVHQFDLSLKGGYALVGRFLAGAFRSPMRREYSTLSNAYPVILFVSAHHTSSSTERLAVVILPHASRRHSVHEKTSFIAQSPPDIEFKICVEQGFVFALYTSYARKLYRTAQAMPLISVIQPFVPGSNTYYALARNLQSIGSQIGVVSVASASLSSSLPPSSPSSNVPTYVQAADALSLPRLPFGYRWGPELAGVLTVVHEIDPYRFLTVLDILDQLDSMPDEHRTELLALVSEQSNRLLALGKTYALIAKNYSK